MQAVHKLFKESRSGISQGILTETVESEYEELKNAEIAKLFSLRFQISPLEYENQDSTQSVAENNNNSIQANPINQNHSLGKKSRLFVIKR